MTKGKIDPTVSRSLALLTIPSSALASWGARGHQDWVKPHSWEVAGRDASVLKATVRVGASADTDRGRAIIYTSLYLYIRYRHRVGGGTRLSSCPPLHFCSPTYRGSRGVRRGSFGGGGLGLGPAPQGY